MAGRDGAWIPTEALAAERLRGTTDYDHVEISEDRALDLLRRWVESGRLERMPEIGPAPDIATPPQIPATGLRGLWQRLRG